MWKKEIEEGSVRRFSIVLTVLVGGLVLYAAMVAAVRVSLARAIVQSIVGLEPELPVITLEPRLEQILLNSLQKAGQGLSAAGEAPSA